MTKDIIKLLPKNYQIYINSNNLDPFLDNFFIDINKIVDSLINQKNLTLWIVEELYILINVWLNH